MGSSFDVPAFIFFFDFRRMALENYGKMYLRAGFTSLISSSQKRLLFTEKLNKSQEMENFTVHTNSTVCKKK